MKEKKKRRYPADRMRLHALLDKRETQLRDLTEEVEELRGLVTAADHLAITDATDALNVTPEQLIEFLEVLKSGAVLPGISPKTNKAHTAGKPLEGKEMIMKEENVEDDDLENE